MLAIAMGLQVLPWFAARVAISALVLQQCTHAYRTGDEDSVQDLAPNTETVPALKGPCPCATCKVPDWIDLNLDSLSVETCHFSSQNTQWWCQVPDSCDCAPVMPSYWDYLKMFGAKGNKWARCDNGSPQMDHLKEKLGTPIGGGPGLTTNLNFQDRGVICKMWKEAKLKAGQEGDPLVFNRYALFQVNELDPVCELVDLSIWQQKFQEDVSFQDSFAVGLNDKVEKERNLAISCGSGPWRNQWLGYLARPAFVEAMEVCRTYLNAYFPKTNSVRDFLEGNPCHGLRTNPGKFETDLKKVMSEAEAKERVRICTNRWYSLKTAMDILVNEQKLLKEGLQKLEEQRLALQDNSGVPLRRLPPVQVTQDTSPFADKWAKIEKQLKQKEKQQKQLEAQAQSLIESSSQVQTDGFNWQEAACGKAWKRSDQDLQEQPCNFVPQY